MKTRAAKERVFADSFDFRRELRASKSRASLEDSFWELFEIRRKRRAPERPASVEDPDADRLGVADQLRRFERFTFREDSVPEEGDGGGKLDVA